MVRSLEMPVGYDKLALYNMIALDLPFKEAVGLEVFDHAKPQRRCDLNGPPTWGQIASGLTTLTFDGAADYIDCAAADTGDLDFTTGDYSIAAWVNYSDTTRSQIVIGRYGVDLDGWEVYLDASGVTKYLTQRHHQAADRQGCYSVGWAENTWCLLGISRSGLYPVHYRNGVALEMDYTVGGLLDPATCNRDLVLGTRFTKDDNFYQGQKQRPRVWGRELSTQDHLMLFEMERKWFGV